MIDKLDYYDILSVIVPGTVLIGWIPLCFPALLRVSAPKYPEAFSVIVLIVLALLLGQMVDALASLIEPLLYWSFGGRPSDLLLSKNGLAGKYEHYISGDAITRIKAKIAQAIGVNVSDSSLFQYAIQRSYSVTSGRAARFNSQYAYNRGLVVLFLLMLVTFSCSLKYGAAAKLSGSAILLVIGAFCLLCLLTWHRAKQWGFYYAREILYTAERAIDDKLFTGAKMIEAS